MIKVQLFPTAKECSKAAQKSMKDPTVQGTILFLTPEYFQTLFSPERLRILLLLKEGPQLNISDIAKKLHRSFEAVHRDIKMLESNCILTTHKTGRTVIPRLAADVNIPIVARSSGS